MGEEIQNQGQRIAPLSQANRRTFLKILGAGVAAASVECPLKAEALSGESSGGPEPRLPAPVDQVNCFQGTNSSQLFSRGNTLPISALPFGMAHWTIQTAIENEPWFFHPSDQRTEGFRCTHQLSPWLGDYGYATLLPFSGSPSPEAAARASSYRQSEIVFKPHVIKIKLLRYGCTAEMAPTERGAIMRLSFADGEAAGLMIDLPGQDAEFHMDREGRVLTGTTKANSGGVSDNFAAYYVFRFDSALSGFEVKHLHDHKVGVVVFAPSAGQKIGVRIASSFISTEQAARNLDRELSSKPFDQIALEAREVWEHALGRVEVEGGSVEQQQIFYSCLYRALLFPRIWHEPDADGRLFHFSPYNGKVEPGVMYADHGYWDVYRAWYPLMSIVYPERLSEILQAWVNAYSEGGWLPQFPAPGYRACMTGSLIDSVFGDAAAKGIGGFDLAVAYAGLKKHAMQPGDPDRGYGRRGIEDYVRLGYVSANHVEQSVAETVDAAYGDFCIAQVARALGHNEEASMFSERSRNWRRLFDPRTGFLRGKQENGSWLEPFDEFGWGSPYVEGSAWQHRWDVPHDIQGLIQALGGNERAVAVLDKMLTLPPIFHVGVYGQEIHEMSEMAAVDFGQYAQSNQPVHHLLYIFALAGRPDRTQYWVRRVMSELYTRETFPGDEDTGSMAAWFLLSAMGFYPLCPGKAEYVAGGPLFDRITLHLPNGEKTVIEARGQSASAPHVSKLLIDGREHPSPVIPHDVIARGARLTFLMQAVP